MSLFNFFIFEKRFSVLKTVFENQNSNIAGLAKKCNITFCHTKFILKMLEKEKLIEIKVKENKNEKIINTTENGRKVVKIINELKKVI